jgi:hypothetical protein
MKKFLSYLYPFLFALYPILELRNHNITYVAIASLIRPILLSVLLTVVTWVILRLIVGDWQKSGIITTLALILFFSYGHVFIQIESTFGILIRHRHLILIYASILLLLGILILWKVKKTDSLVNFLTVTGGVLVIFSIVSMLRYDLHISSRSVRTTSPSSLAQTISKTDVTQNQISTDSVDAHTSVRTLKEQFDYDASAFEGIEDLGFYGRCVQILPDHQALGDISLYKLRSGLRHLPTSSPVTETLRRGYRVITFENAMVISLSARICVFPAIKCCLAA